MKMFHEFDVDVWREYSSDRINYIMNHPSCRPFVASKTTKGDLDVTKWVDNEKNFLLMGEHGCLMLAYLQPGVYEVHTQILPQGRGEWAKKFVLSAQHWMFTRTDMYEVLSRADRSRSRVKAFALSTGLTHQFTRPTGALNDHNEPVDIYGLRIQDWLNNAPNLEDIGLWLHEFFAREMGRLRPEIPLHDVDDPNHNRHAGAALAMILNGQHQKGICLYNRWLSISRHYQGGKLCFLKLLSDDPLAVEIDIGVMTWDGTNLEIKPWAV